MRPLSLQKPKPIGVGYKKHGVPGFFAVVLAGQHLLPLPGGSEAIPVFTLEEVNKGFGMYLEYQTVQAIKAAVGRKKEQLQLFEPKRPG